MKDQSAPQRLLSTCMYTHANICTEHNSRQGYPINHQKVECLSPHPRLSHQHHCPGVTPIRWVNWRGSQGHIVGCRGIAYRKQRKEAQIHAHALTVMGSENSYSSDMDITKSQASGKFLFFLPCQNKNHKTALALTRRQFKCTHQLQIQKCF